MKTSNGGNSFLDQVIKATPGGEKLVLCLQCGTCGGSCPSGPDMDYSPRMIFAMTSAGMKDQVLSSNTPWFCVSCYYCTVRCPQEIPITDIMYTLKQLAIQEGRYEQRKASDFSEHFIGYVENYGRSFELGLATRYFLFHNPLKLVNMGMGMGMSMILRGRMGFIPERIKNMDQLQNILDKAKQIAKEGAA
ncbi:MAG: 4Fe-4S dicluster domain-containing protein [Anaerolineae bacterium]|nr:4Fe-4S dicluster domain-containing protein [Anaerolineae bacterium]